MRKLFLLSLALLASFSLWAADPDYESYDWDQTEFSEVVGTHGDVTISTSGLGSSGNVGGHYYFNNNQNLKNSDSSWKYFGISASETTIDSIEVLWCVNSSTTSETSIGWVAWGVDVTPNQYTLAHGVTESLVSKNKSWDDRKWSKIDLSSVEASTIYLSRSIREFREIGGSSNLSNFGGSQTFNLLGLRVWLHPSCVTTISTQPSGATIALGDANPELSIVATNAASYAWKESSNGTSYDGASSLGSSASFTPSVNDAVQTKYYYCEVTSSCDGTTVVKSNIVTVNVVASISYYTITLNPAGGTITDATGWTLNDGKYEKEVAEGTEVTMPTFTKANRSFKVWRNNADVDVASPITVTKDTVLTAVWTKTINNTIYSWEGAEGGATEVGGTAAGSTTGYINILSAGYYCLKIEGGTSYDKYVQITLSGDEKVKTGDKITYWGFYNKEKTASARPKMRDGNSPNAEIFNDGSDLPNLYDGTGSPAERTFTVPADINTNKVQITRSQTGSNTWISKLEIVRPTAVEEANIATITFNSNGGSDVASIEVEKGKSAVKPADPTKAGSTFTGWYLNDVAYDWSSTVSADITLVAHWAVAYTVVYFNGADTLGVEAVAVGSHPTASAITSARECYTFNGWKYNDAFVTLNTFAGESGAKYDFIGNWTANYAKSINLEDSVLTYSKKYGYAAALSAANISSAGADALDSLSGSTYRNYPYLGLKYKTGTGIGILVKQGSTLRVRFGNVGANVTVTINGANAETKTSAQLANTHTDSTRVYEYTATSADALVKFTYSNSSALVLKQVMIDKEIVRVHIPALYTVTYNAGAGTCATETASVEFSTDKVILPEIATLPEGMQFDGWYDAATSGTLVGLAGAEYTPSANITLYAYYSKATALDNTAEETKAVKVLENGMLIIEKNGVRYNAQGMVIK